MLTKQQAVSSEPSQRYINIIKEKDVNQALENNYKSFLKLLKKIPHKKTNYAYAEGKWTIKEVLQHIIDCERVFAYRALTFSRNDKNPLPGFDENSWASNASVNDRKWKDMIDEFRHLRKANIVMFNTFTNQQLQYVSTANNKEANVIAWGFICAGHVQHHITILKERYLKK